MKAAFDDRVITTRDIELPDGARIPTGTHGFVIEAFDEPECYEVEFDVEGDQILDTVKPDTFGVA